MAELTCVNLGRAPYAATLALQRRLVEQVRRGQGERAYALLLEHDPPVITLGRRDSAADVLASPRQLAEMGVEVHKTTRGGQATYHGPGQLVCYPIVYVRPSRQSVRRYVQSLEEAIIRLADRFCISAHRREGMIGVWAEAEKLAAIGVAFSRHVAWHGLALNVSTDLSAFELIVPCGIAGGRVTSMERLLGRPVEVAQVRPVLVKCLADVLGLEVATESETDQWIISERPQLAGACRRG